MDMRWLTFSSPCCAAQDTALDPNSSSCLSTADVESPVGTGRAKMEREYVWILRGLNIEERTFVAELHVAPEADELWDREKR